LGIGRLDKGRGGVSIRFKCVKGGESGEVEGGGEGKRRKRVERRREGEAEKR
jgi:hypothetical protein